jgi:hypothetical protein
VDTHAKEARSVIENLGARMKEIIAQEKTVTLSAVVGVIKLVRTETKKLQQGAWKAASDPELHESVRKAVGVAGQGVVKVAGFAVSEVVQRLEVAWLTFHPVPLG